MEFSGEGLGQFCCFYALRAGSPGIPTRSALVCCTDWKQRLYWWESELVLPHLWPQSQLYHLLQVIMGEAGRGSFPYPWHHMADKRAQGQLACSYALIVCSTVGRQLNWVSQVRACLWWGTVFPECRGVHGGGELSHEGDIICYNYSGWQRQSSQGQWRVG